MGDYTGPAKGFSTALADYSVTREDAPGPYARDTEYDAVIVGAGFAGIFMLKTLRDRGYRAVIFEAGNDLGGTWRWNCYPGAMVDSDVPMYQFSWPEVWRDWTWTTNYPDYEELRAYFDHVDAVLDIKKDCAFNTVVVGGRFDAGAGRWTVRTEDGRRTRAKFLVLGTGFSAKRYVPDWPGMDAFGGELHHTSFWPQDRRVDMAGKRCAVIGTGASGVQVAQTWGAAGAGAASLTVFQRTPNLALPMGRRALSREEQERDKKWYPALMTARERTFTGFLFDWVERRTADDDTAAREAVYAAAWRAGGFQPWLAIHKDYLFDAAANREAYAYWARQTRARIRDARKRDLLAPLDMPHAYGIKRPALEDGYYEALDRDAVELVDVGANPIREFTATGIRMADGTHREFDVVAVATGFDFVTGVMTQLGLESTRGTLLADEWSTGAVTYLGTTVPGYPNMFHLYGAHGPTLLANGPSAVEIQGRWVADCIDKVTRGGYASIEARADAARAFKQRVVDAANQTLFPSFRSSYMGGNIPGKVHEPVCFMEGLPAYTRVIRDALDTMEGFDLVKA